MNDTNGLNQILHKYSALQPSQPPSYTNAGASIILSNINNNISTTTNTSTTGYNIGYLNVTDDPSPHILFQPVYLTYLWLALIIGLPGNLLISAVYVTIKHKRTSDWFIFFLAVYDCAVCVFAVPLYLSIETGAWLSTGSDVACKLEQFIIHASQLSSVSILGIIAVDRFLKICHPTKRSLNAQQARNIGLWTPVLSGLAATPILVWEGNIDKRTCMVQDRYRNNWGVKTFVFLTFIFFVCMFIVVSYCYAKVIIVVKRRTRRHKENTLKRKHLMEIPDFLRAISSVEETKKMNKKSRGRRKFSLFSFTSSRRLSVISPWSKARLSLPNENSPDLKESHEMNEIEKKATRESLTESKKWLDKALSTKSGLDTRSSNSDRGRGEMRAERAASFGSRSKVSRHSSRRKKLKGTCSMVSVDEHESNKPSSNKGQSKTSLVINANVGHSASKDSLVLNTNWNCNDFRSVSKTSLVAKNETGIRETKSKNSLVLNVNDIVGGLSAGIPSRRRSHALGVSDAYTQSWTQKHDALWSEQLKRARSNPSAFMPRDASDEFKDLAVSKVSMVEPDSTGFERGIPIVTYSSNNSEEYLHSNTKATERRDEKTEELTGVKNKSREENLHGIGGKPKRKSKKKSYLNVCAKLPSEEKECVHSESMYIENVDIQRHVQQSENDVGDVGTKSISNEETVVDGMHARKLLFPEVRTESKFIPSDYNTTSGFHISGDGVEDRGSSRLLSLAEALRLSRHSCDDHEDNVTESTSFLRKDTSNGTHRKGSEPNSKTRTKKLRKYFSFTTTSPSKKATGESSDSKGFYRTLKSLHGSLKSRKTKRNKSSHICDAEVGGRNVEERKDGEYWRDNENEYVTKNKNGCVEKFDFEDDKGEKRNLIAFEKTHKRKNVKKKEDDENDEEENEMLKLFRDDVYKTPSPKHQKSTFRRHTVSHVGEGLSCEIIRTADSNIDMTGSGLLAKPEMVPTGDLCGICDYRPNTERPLLINQSNCIVDKPIKDLESVSQEYYIRSNCDHIHQNHQHHHHHHYYHHRHQREQQQQHHRECNYHPLSPNWSEDKYRTVDKNNDGCLVDVDINEIQGRGREEGGFVSAQPTITSDEANRGGLAPFLVPRECGNGVCGGDGLFCGRGDDGGSCVLKSDFSRLGKGDKRENNGKGSCCRGVFVERDCDDVKGSGIISDGCEAVCHIDRNTTLSKSGSGHCQSHHDRHNQDKHGPHQYDNTSSHESIQQPPTCTGGDAPTQTPYPLNDNKRAPPDRLASINGGKLHPRENNGCPSMRVTLGDRAGITGFYGASACQTHEQGFDQASNIAHQNESRVDAQSKSVRTDNFHKTKSHDLHRIQSNKVGHNEFSRYLDNKYASQTYPPSEFRHSKTGCVVLGHGKCHSSNQSVENQQNKIRGQCIRNCAHKPSKQNIDPFRSTQNTISSHCEQQRSNSIPNLRSDSVLSRNDKIGVENVDMNCTTKQNDNLIKSRILNIHIKLAIENQQCLFSPSHSCQIGHQFIFFDIYSTHFLYPQTYHCSTYHNNSTYVSPTCASSCNVEFYINLLQLLSIYNLFSTNEAATTKGNNSSSSLPTHLIDENASSGLNSHHSSSRNNQNDKSRHNLDLVSRTIDGSISSGSDSFEKMKFGLKSLTKETKQKYNVPIHRHHQVLSSQTQFHDYPVIHPVDQIRTCDNQPISILFHELLGYHYHRSVKSNELFGQNNILHNNSPTSNHAASLKSPFQLSEVSQCSCADCVILECTRALSNQPRVIPMWSVQSVNAQRYHYARYITQSMNKATWEADAYANELSRDEYSALVIDALSPFYRNNNPTWECLEKLRACSVVANDSSALNNWTLNPLTIIWTISDAGRGFDVDIDILNRFRLQYFYQTFNKDSTISNGTSDSKGQKSRFGKQCCNSNEDDLQNTERGSSCNMNDDIFVDSHSCEKQNKAGVPQTFPVAETKLDTRERTRKEDGIDSVESDIKNRNSDYHNEKTLRTFKGEISLKGVSSDNDSCTLWSADAVAPALKRSDICCISIEGETKEKNVVEKAENSMGSCTYSHTPHPMDFLNADGCSEPHTVIADSLHSKQTFIDGEENRKPKITHDDRVLHENSFPVPQQHTKINDQLKDQENMSVLLLSVPLRGQSNTTQIQIENEKVQKPKVQDQTNAVPSLLISHMDSNTIENNGNSNDVFHNGEDIHLLNVGKQKKRASSWSVTDNKTSNVQRYTNFDKIHSSLLGCLPSIKVGSNPEKGSMPAIHVPTVQEDTCQIFARSVIGAFFSSGKSSCASDPCLQLNDDDYLDGIKVTAPSTEEILEAMKKSEDYVTTSCLGDSLRAGDDKNELGSFPQRRHSSFQTYCKTIGRFGRLARRANGRITHSWYSLDDLQDNCASKIPSRSVTKLAYLATIGSQIQEAFSMKNIRRVFSTNLFKSLSRHLDHVPGTKKSFLWGQGQDHSQGNGDATMTCNHIDVIITRCESIVMDGSQMSLERSNGYGGTYETHHSPDDNQVEVHTSNESSATNTTTHNQHANMAHHMRTSHSYNSGVDTPSSLSRSDDQSIMSRSHDTSIDRLRGISLDLLSPMSASVRGSVCSGLSTLSKATECSAYTENSRSDCEKITRRSAEREHNITKLLGVITLIFVVSWSVSWSINLMHLAVAITDTPTNHVILSLGQNMFLMNHFCNIFFYTFFSKSFREKLIHFYNERSKKCRQQENPSLTSRSIRN